MAMNLAPFLKSQFFDSNGDPLAAGKIYSYQSGTTTPQATYTDSSGSTPNANPIILDAGGEASIWLDPTLSYKFVFQTSAGLTVRTQDNIIGLLSVNTVDTDSLVDGAVTTAKLEDDSVTAAKLKDSASVDADRSVTTNHIRDAAITRAKISSLAWLAPTVRKYTTGSGTHNKMYAFAITAGNATAGATYTNNGVTYTVQYTIASGTVLHASGSSQPTASGTLTKSGGTGDSAITFSVALQPTYARVRMIGGGGGGAGGGTAGSPGTGGTGGATTFGSSLLTANGGLGGVGAGAGGVGGSASLGTGPIGSALSGASGGQGLTWNVTGTNIRFLGGFGAGSPFAGPNTGNGQQVSAHVTPVANSGTGGGGGFGQDSNVGGVGGGGGAGGFIDAIILAPLDATYAYAVGTAGSAGSAGTSAGAGSVGAAGYIEVTEFFQ